MDAATKMTTCLVHFVHQKIAPVATDVSRVRKNIINGSSLLLPNKRVSVMLLVFLG